MMQMIRRYRRDTRGATLAVTAVMLLSLLSVTALALDLGMLRLGRTEAQRAADSAALAGASAFLNFTPPATAVGPAQNRAYEYALAHEVRNIRVDSAEVTVQVDPNLRRVHVFIRRLNNPMWFARLFGIATAPVAASAMAHASPANTTNCLAPLALPDWWHDPDDDTNGNRIPDGTENWQWGDDPTESYEAYATDVTSETGLGSLWRTDITRDQGRLMIIKPQSPSPGNNNNNPIQLNPGWFFPIRLPNNADGSTNQGAQDYRQSFTNCRSGAMSIGDTIDLEMGNMVGPTRQAINDVYCLDPAAHWNPTTHQVEGGQGWSSPRILTISLFHPAQLTQIVGGNHEFTPNNFALYFIEPIPGPLPNCNSQGGGGGGQVDVYGRFLQFANGTNQGGGPTGTLILRVQLIQ